MGKLNTVQNGKTSKRRPNKVPLDKVNDNWDHIDWSKKEPQPPEPEKNK